MQYKKNDFFVYFSPEHTDLDKPGYHYVTSNKDRIRAVLMNKATTTELSVSFTCI